MFGCHVDRCRAKGKGPRPPLDEQIEAARAEAAGAGLALTAAAVFVASPRGRAITLRAAERPRLRAYIEATGVRVIAHSTYAAAPWRGDPGAAQFVREELGVCQAAGIVGLVVHLPKLPPAEVVRHAAGLCNPAAPDVRLFFETPAVTPPQTYYETPAKLAALFRALREAGLPDFGLCVDTAHLWTCGVDLRTHAAAAAWLGGLEAAAAEIPPDRVCLHLNDSLRARGVGPAAHAPLAGPAGQIWGAYRARLGESGLAAFTDYAQRHSTPTILERKPPEALLGDYAVLGQLLQRP